MAKPALTVVVIVFAYSSSFRTCVFSGFLCGFEFASITPLVAEPSPSVALLLLLLAALQSTCRHLNCASHVCLPFIRCLLWPVDMYTATAARCDVICAECRPHAQRADRIIFEQGPIWWLLLL